MKVGIPGISPEAAAGRTPATGDGALAVLKWRRALEQAQWELTGGDRATVEKAGAAHRAAPSMHEVTPSPVLRPDAAASAAHDQSTLPATLEPGAAPTHADPGSPPDGGARASR